MEYFIKKYAVLKRILIIPLLLCCLACNSGKENSDIEEAKIPFDETKWETKKGEDYLYRDRMLEDLIGNETFREYTSDEVLERLGVPDYYRDDSSYLYYRITEDRIGFLTLKTKTLVIKLSEDNRISWMKVHE
jgi:hypothetical protein